MRTLTLYDLENYEQLVFPENLNTLDLNSPATEILTDFTHYQPRVIDDNIKAYQVEEIMMKVHVRLQLVIDENKELIGTVCLNQVNSQAIQRHVASGQDRETLLVKDVMTPREQCKALDLNDINNATIANIVETLKQNCQQHCLVVDHENQKISGLISASDIARRLHIPIVIDEMPSFAKIFELIHNH